MPFQDLMLTLCLATERAGAPVPLTLSEWCDVKKAVNCSGVSPGEMVRLGKNELVSRLGFSQVFADRVFSLLHREISLFFTIEHYKSQGIALLTYEHRLFPQTLKSKLGMDCPPILCAKGDFALLEREGIGILSSRLVGEQDQIFAASLVPQIVEQKNKVVVLGGINGIMANLREKIAHQNGNVMVFMVTPLSQANALSCPAGGLLLSLPAHTKGSFEERAILRNLCVMAFSQSTVILKAEDQRGSTYLAVHKALEKGISPLLCHRVSRYAGNTKLFQKGAIPISSGQKICLPQ